MKNLKSLFALGLCLLISSCGVKEIKIDPCVYLEKENGHCFPLNQPGKDEYDRKINTGDYFLDPNGVALARAKYEELQERLKECQQQK